MTEQKIVTAVAISVNTVHNDAVNKHLEKIMADEVLKCTAEGISTEEHNSAVIRSRMQAAHDREVERLATLEREALRKATE